ncbi:MAG: hypothetical protein ACI93P_002034 [bacterium]
MKKESPINSSFLFKQKSHFDYVLLFKMTLRSTN